MNEPIETSFLWSDLEVAQLRLKQSDQTQHPYTCGGKDRNKCPNEGILIPTVMGWVCPCGTYRQDWYHK